MKTLTEKALEIAKRKCDAAWDRHCKATIPGARAYWEAETNRYGRLAARLVARLRG